MNADEALRSICRDLDNEVTEAWTDAEAESQVYELEVLSLRLQELVLHMKRNKRDTRAASLKNELYRVLR